MVTYAGLSIAWWTATPIWGSSFQIHKTKFHCQKYFSELLHYQAAQNQINVCCLEADAFGFQVRIGPYTNKRRKIHDQYFCDCIYFFYVPDDVPFKCFYVCTLLM